MFLQEQELPVHRDFSWDLQSCVGCLGRKVLGQELGDGCRQEMGNLTPHPEQEHIPHAYKCARGYMYRCLYIYT